MHRLSRLIVKAHPKNPIARNNFIRLSLLRRLNEDAPQQLAADLSTSARRTSPAR